jgi:hypothetical protein
MHEMGFYYARYTSCRKSDFDNNHYLVVEKFREKLEVRKQAARNFEGGRFKLCKINELEVVKQYQIEIINRFISLENLNDGEDIHRDWQKIEENMKTSAKGRLGLHDLKQ